jgi:hypothetical protein
MNLRMNCSGVRMPSGNTEGKRNSSTSSTMMFGCLRVWRREVAPAIWSKRPRSARIPPVAMTPMDFKN